MLTLIVKDLALTKAGVHFVFTHYFSQVKPILQYMRLNLAFLLTMLHVGPS
jgi:hypothetical protein